MARTDKAMRILSTQLELLRGGKVYKKSYCKKNEVSARTFDRDIVEIRMSLSESFSGQEVKYVRNENYYYLDKDGKMLTGWVYHDGNYYYMKSWGGMAAGTTTPDGYQVDWNGAWIKA